MPLETIVVPPTPRSGATAAPGLPARVIKRDGAHAAFELGEDRVGDRPRRRRDRRIRRGRGRPAGRRRRPRPRPPVRGRRARHREGAGHRRADARSRRFLRHRARLYRLPRPPRAAARRSQDAGRRRRVGRRVPGAEGLARQRQRQPGLFARRPDPQRLGQGRRQLLAVARLRAGDRARAPRRRRPHPRPRHARRLLRRLVAAPAAARRLERRPRQGRGRPAEAHVERRRPDRQLPRHAAERMGGRAGVLVVRHLHGAVRPPRRDGLRRGEAEHPGADLQPQRALALGHADAVHQPHVRLGVPGGPARADSGDRRRGNAVRLRRPAGRDGHDQPRVHRGDDDGRRQGPRVHVPDPDVQHHAGVRLGPSQLRARCSR